MLLQKKEKDTKKQAICNGNGISGSPKRPKSNWGQQKRKSKIKEQNLQKGNLRRSFFRWGLAFFSFFHTTKTPKTHQVCIKARGPKHKRVGLLSSLPASAPSPAPEATIKWCLNIFHYPPC